MAVKITSVEKGSAGSRKGIKSGDTLISINDHEIFDVLDYRFYADTDDMIPMIFICASVTPRAGSASSISVIAMG